MNLRRPLILCAVLGLAGPLHGISPRFLQEHVNRLDPLFESLDPEHPQTGSICRLWEAGEREQAADLLLAYFEGKSFPPGLLTPPWIPGDLMEQADAALDGAFYLLGRREEVARRPDGGPDWGDRGSRGDKERAWMLNRHSFLPILAEAWHRTADPRYRNQLNHLLQDWILNNPYPGGLSFSPQWRPLEVARRVMNAWIPVFHEDGLLDPETRLLVLSSIPDHADSLRHHASFWGGNHLITEKVALLALSVAWPEFRQAGEWSGYAVEKVEAQILRQTYPDGSYRELSNHYQRVILANAGQFLRLLARIDPDFRRRPVYGRIEQMWDFLAGVMRPDGHGPLSNASDREYNAGFLVENWGFFDRKDWLGMATHGARGILPPGSPSRFFPWAGQVVIRENWGPRSDWIYFDAGPHGTAHQHVDRLHVSASINGRPVLADSGRYTYKPGMWSDYFKGPEGHSILLLDGEAPLQGPLKVEKPMPVVFEESPETVFAAARARFSPRKTGGLLPSLKGPAPWTRAILYDKRGFALIVDHLVLFSDRRLEARWHFHPETAAEEAGGYLRLAYPEGAFVQSVQEGRETPPLGGFFSPAYNVRQPAPLLRVLGTISEPTTLVWILQRPEAPPIRLRVRSTPGAPLLVAELRQDGEIIAEASIRLHPDPALLKYHCR